MTDHHLRLAQQVVADFRNSLSGEAREYITAAQLEDLGRSSNELN